MADGTFAHNVVALPHGTETRVHRSRQSARLGGGRFSLLPRRVDRVDFVVAGVQKAGTTALHYFLSRHPHVALPRDQALHFFDQGQNFEDGPNYDALHGNFDPGWRWRTAGEVTADYVYYTPALPRIAEYNPAMKIVISLRNPADRAFSHWNMRRAKGREALDFLAAIERDVKEIPLGKLRGNAHVERGFYTLQMKRVFDLFPRKQVHVIKYEDFRRDFARTVTGMFDFLGLEQLPALKNQETNAGPYQRKMTREERHEVASLFEEDISELEELIGWNCSDWRPNGK